MANTPHDAPFPKSGMTPPEADAAIDQAAAAERDVMRRVVQGAHEAVDRIADKAIPAVERLRGTYNDAAEAVRQKTDQALDLKDEWIESLRTTVREHPLAAIGTALALGVVLAKLTSRSDR